MNAIRLAFGTLTILPVSPPRVVDPKVAGWAMVLAPLVGLVLAAPLWGLTELLRDQWSPLLLATVWVAGLALLTRAIHLDGLADTADGLGSGKPAEQALEIMRKSDVGPFGVATLVVCLLAQVAAASQLLSGSTGPAYVAVAVVVSRLVLPWACLFRPARVDGLGSTVARSVTWIQALVASLCLLVVVLEPELVLAPLGLLAGVAFVAWCVRRLGGTTGDVLGAGVEVTFTGALLGLTFV